MEVCCLKMASRCRPVRPTKDITQLSSAGSSHDCGALSRVVMVRKTDQRVINHKGSKKDPLCEVITMETIQTYKGHKPDRTVVFKEKFDLTDNDMCRSQSTGKLSAGSPRLSISPLRTILTTSAELERTRGAAACDRNNNNTAPTASHSAVQSLASSKTVAKQSSISRSTVSIGTSTPQRPKSLDRTKDLQNHLKSPSIGSLRSYGTQSYRRGSASMYTEFERDCLKAHNQYRTRHGVPPLKLCKRLCRYAEEWAKVIAARGVLVHRSNSQYGENIFCSWSSSNTVSVSVTGQEPVENWYSEIDLHVFGKEPATLKTGHFTQVVWKDSRELGVGVARNRSGQVFVVANYDPPGNYIGSFAKNVPPLGGFEVPKIIVDKASAAMQGTKKTETDSIMDSKTSKTSAQQRSRENRNGNEGEAGIKLEKHVRIVDENDPDEFNEFCVAVLKHHNEFRRKHGAPNLILHKELVNDAQQWADILARDDRFTYRQNSKYGENLYCLWSSDRNALPNAREVCRSWYEEAKQFTFNVEPRTAVKGGQFTQMVWKGTKELGVGISKTRSGKVIVVCTYYPRGNVLGQFLANVCKAR